MIFVSSADHLAFELPLPRLALLPSDALYLSPHQARWLQAACIAWGTIQPQDSIPELGKLVIFRRGGLPWAAKLCKS